MERVLVYVDDGVPEETTRLLTEACAQRSVDLIPVHPAMFDYRPERRLPAGTMMFRPAVSLAASRVEQFLYGEGVATFYRRDEDVFSTCINPSERYQRAGFPIPRTIHCDTSDRDLLRGFVEQLGGFPIVVKTPGYSNGIGVMRADSFATLFSTVDLMQYMGTSIVLMTYVPDATHWRLVVVGDEVVASYQNVTEDDDFRTYASEDLLYYAATPSADMRRAAVEATHLMGHDLGGVDILEHPSGRFYLLESNFPCYFAQAQLVAGVDVAGAMVEYLLAKAERLVKDSVSESVETVA